MPAKFTKPNAAVLAARARRGATAGQSDVKIDWYIDEVLGKVDMTLARRVKIAGEHVKTRVVKNISRPVTIGKGPRGGRVVINRSKPGEFPKADTKQLMRTIFTSTQKVAGNSWEAIVGTPLDYGLILETRMERSFLKRTLEEERSRVVRILTGPIK